MDERSTNEELLTAWRLGEQRAATILVDRYLVRLTSLVRARLSRRLARRVDPEDIVLSAWRSFFFAASNGLASPDAEDELWPILATITLRKLARQASRQRAECRSVDREVETEGVIALTASDPTAEDAIAVADEVESILAGLDAFDREIFVRRMRGETAHEIAIALDCSDRTVRRAGERIRSVVAARSQAEDGTLLPTRGEPISPAMKREVIADSSIEVSAPTFATSDFLMQQMVGEGGFGKVYRSLLRKTGETVAVKFLRKRLWSDRRAMTLLLREAAMLERLSFPGIVRGRGWGRTPYGAAFLVTEFIEGECFERWLKRVRPSVFEITEAVAEVVAALTFAHAHGIMHSDLKPSNVLRRDDGRLVLADFGFSLQIGEHAHGMLAGGTAGFLAPEQISDAFGLPGPATDVYGLGGVLYAALTGEPPATGRDAPEILARVLSSVSPQAPSTRFADVPPALDEIVMRCLEKEPARRFATMQDLRCALTTCCSSMRSGPTTRVVPLS
ncbi:MAG: protein kinase [Planctomycetaceae bacterium]|nr:protein kinase [Planctomycetaceae bacterium]